MHFYHILVNYINPLNKQIDTKYYGQNKYYIRLHFLLRINTKAMFMSKSNLSVSRFAALRVNVNRIMENQEVSNGNRHIRVLTP